MISARYEYDAIIAGASFAGLAVASSLNGKILMIDRKSVGSLPVSACGTVQPMVAALGLEDTMLSSIDRLRLHVSDKHFDFALKPQWCTFDYQRFCQGLLSRFKGELLRAHIRGIEGNTVVTSEGNFSARCIVDCTGWRAFLAKKISHGYFDRHRMGFAIEAVVDCESDRFHFFHDNEIIRQGIAWIFPAGKHSRIGVGSYIGRTDIKPQLESMLASQGVAAISMHGGFIPWRLRPPVSGKVFVVGDAAGMIFAVVGEGIRQSNFFGQACASFIQDVIDGKCSNDEALTRYSRFVAENRRPFDFFAKRQEWITSASMRNLGIAASLLSTKPVAAKMQQLFGEIYSYESPPCIRGE